MNNNKSYNVRYTLMLCGVATLGGFLFGFDSGVINGTIDGLQSSFNSSEMATGFNVASMLLGCAVGAFFAGQLADIIGRKFLLLASAILFLISAWGSGISNTANIFIFYRLIGGLAVGAASVMSPAYISEISPTHIRGRLACMQQIAIISGLFIAFLSNYFLAEIAGNSTHILWFGFEAWRWMFWMEIIPAALFLIALLRIPESPRYLVLKGQPDQALKVLTKIQNPELAKNIVKTIASSLAGENKHQHTSVLSHSGKNLKPIIWIGIGLACFQQFVGINVVFYYGAVLWQAVGFTESHALLINVVSGLLSVLAVIGALLLIDKIGRKPLLLIGSIGMFFSLAIITATFSAAIILDGNLTLSNSHGITALICANLYVIFFNLSWGPVMWVMLGEMFPNSLRGRGLAIAGLSQWFSNFLITMSFPVLLVAIGLSNTYSIYAICAALAAVFVWFYVHETKGISLEEMR